LVYLLSEVLMRCDSHNVLSVCDIFFSGKDFSLALFSASYAEKMPTAKVEETVIIFYFILY